MPHVFFLLFDTPLVDKNIYEGIMNALLRDHPDIQHTVDGGSDYRIYIRTTLNGAAIKNLVNHIKPLQVHRMGVGNYGLSPHVESFIEGIYPGDTYLSEELDLRKEDQRQLSVMRAARRPEKITGSRQGGEVVQLFPDRSPA